MVLPLPRQRIGLIRLRMPFINDLIIAVNQFAVVGYVAIIIELVILYSPSERHELILLEKLSENVLLAFLIEHIPAFM